MCVKCAFQSLRESRVSGGAAPGLACEMSPHYHPLQQRIMGVTLSPVTVSHRNTVCLLCYRQKETAHGCVRNRFFKTRYN